MKNLTAIFSALLCLQLASFSASARSMQTSIETNLGHILVNGVQKKHSYAEVKIDFLNKSLSVSVFHDPCPAPANPRAFKCMAMPYIAASFKVPVTISRDGCNSTVIVGKKDERAVHGALVNVEMKDNTLRICDDVTVGKYVINATIESSDDATGTTTKTHYLMY